MVFGNASRGFAATAAELAAGALAAAGGALDVEAAARAGRRRRLRGKRRCRPVYALIVYWLLIWRRLRLNPAGFCDDKKNHKLFSFYAGPARAPGIIPEPRRGVKRPTGVCQLLAEYGGGFYPIISGGYYLKGVSFFGATDPAGSPAFTPHDRRA
jgi:hypothetical protein